ncbi:MAG: hypothetical protein ABEH66_01160 [Halobacteriales archaeon]
MTDDDDPVQHCELAAQADLAAALDAAAIEHLGIDEHRTVVIYQTAILTLTVTDGQLGGAHAFDVDLWEPPVRSSDRAPDELVTACLDELVAATGTERR